VNARSPIIVVLVDLTINIMSKITKEKNIKEELKKIRDIIELKTMRGMSHGRETLKYRFLLYRLCDIHRSPKISSSWFSRTVNVLGVLVF